MGTQVDRSGRLALSSAGHGRAVVPVHRHEAFLSATLFSEANPIHSVARSHLLWAEAADLIPGGFIFREQLATDYRRRSFRTAAVGPHYCRPKKVAPPN